MLCGKTHSASPTQAKGYRLESVNASTTGVLDKGVPYCNGSPFAHWKLKSSLCPGWDDIVSRHFQTVSWGSKLSVQTLACTYVKDYIFLPQSEVHTERSSHPAHDHFLNQMVFRFYSHFFILGSNSGWTCPKQSSYIQSPWESLK